MPTRENQEIGFPNRTQPLVDNTAPAERRVAALCDALTHCHLGFNEGKKALQKKFSIRIGEPMSNEQFLSACDFLEHEWKQRSVDKKSGATVID